MSTEPNGSQVTGRMEPLNICLLPNGANPQILTSDHWRGLMGVAVVLGVAWINLSRLPAQAEITEPWGHLLRMVLLWVVVPVLTSGIYLLCRTPGVESCTFVWRGFPPFQIVDRNSLPNAASPPSWNRVADSVAMGTTFILILLDIVNFVGGRAYGTATAVPWAVNVEGVMRHPVQLYSAFALSVLLVVLWRMRSRLFPGETLWHFAMFYSLIQLIAFDFCASAVTWGAGIRLEQILTLVTLLGSMYVLSAYAQRRTDAAMGDLGQERRGRR